MLRRPSPVPAANGLYAWYFSDLSATVPTEGCLTLDRKTLLYIGIAPDKASRTAANRYYAVSSITTEETRRAPRSVELSACFWRTKAGFR